MSGGQFDIARWNAGPDLGYPGLDDFVTELPGYRYAVVAVLDEVDGPYPVDIDRREVLAPTGRSRDPLPSAPDPTGGRPELAIEAMTTVHSPDDRVNRNRPEAELLLTCPPQRFNDLIEKQDRLATTLDLGRERAKNLAPAGPGEVSLCVL